MAAPLPASPAIAPPAAPPAAAPFAPPPCLVGAHSQEEAVAHWGRSPSVAERTDNTCSRPERVAVASDSFAEIRTLQSSKLGYPLCPRIGPSFLRAGCDAHPSGKIDLGRDVRALLQWAR